MKPVQYTVTFHTPAFLGDAQQNGRWRTPPFKAQLRQWWRVAYAAKHGFRVSVADMRREEGLLFGNAWLQDEFRKSQVRLRLDRWEDGTLTRQKWTALSSVSHPEVPMLVDSGLYLGYGPVTLPRGASKATLKATAAIQAKEFATLSLAYPEESATLIEQALWLMHCYGTVGGRSRNGWGSYELSSSHSGRGAGGEGVPLRDWRDCLALDWPHAIGRDEKGPLIWQTTEHGDWQQLMRTLAIIKIGLRTQFRFTTGHSATSPEERHWLSYPVTNHDVRRWKQNNLRLPNSLRFKVRRQGDKLVGVIFHMPCLPPPSFDPDRAAIIDVWKCVHRFLDNLCRPPAQLCPDADHKALAKQKQQLAGITLKRIPE
jgi:CRISPR-associated protein Cmr1